jgi:hypothetical protein
MKGAIQIVASRRRRICALQTGAGRRPPLSPDRQAKGTACFEQFLGTCTE